MKLINTNLLLVLLIFSSCGDSSQKIDLSVEKQIIEDKNYPSTNNYPEADISDKAMEADFVRAYNTYEKKELTAQNAIITSRDWVVYNDYSSKPTKRNRIVVVTTQIENRCFLQHLFVQQDADGSGYGKTYVSDVYGWKEFDCNLKNDNK